jgi:hypothetical protein
MIEKEAMAIVYLNISPVTLVEINGLFNIYKHNVENRYMVVKMNNNDSDVSPIFTTIEESREWSQL